MGRRYTNYKIFHFPEKLKSLPQNTPSIMPPVNVRIKPTNRCNHNCWYCAYKLKDLQLGREMSSTDQIPREKMFEIVQDLIDMQVKAVTFSGGGEPFCYPHFVDVLEKLTQSNIRFASLTNGSKLTGEAADIFAHHGTWIRISLDGWDDESYAMYRGTKSGSFSTLLKNISNFVKLGGTCALGVCINVDKNNASHVYNLTKTLKETGINSVKIAPCLISNSSKENNKYHEPFFNKVRQQIELAFSNLYDGNFEIFDSYHTQLNTFVKSYNWCPSTQIVPVIGADLNIYSCQDKAYNNMGFISSIKDTTFKDAWMKNKEKFFKIDPSIDCNHHCIKNASNKNIIEYLEVDIEHSAFV